MHSSVKLDTPCELINVTPINPLISKCQIKVCYVGDQPNRNRSIITKDVAREMANSIPGSPIVGYFNEEKGDFEEHNRTIDVSNGKFRIKDGTRPYGFVDLGAKVWFQKFLDDGQNEHEYLMTEGYIWTGQYPESKRIIEHGNNQSMELDKDLIDATWTKDENGKPQFFIINEAIVSKLCVLGEDCEPCFEGSNITKLQFSFDDDFKQELFSMMNELKELLNKGGAQEVETTEVKSPIVEEEAPATFAEEVKVEETVTPAEEVEFKKDEEEKKEEDKEEKSETSDSEDKAECKDSSEEEKEEKNDSEEDKDDEKKKKKNEYSLEDISEYVDLQNQFSELQSKYDALLNDKAALEAQVQSLSDFKAKVEKTEKEEMIKSFYMLSEEDKKDVVENIDTYSLSDIEAKLSIICVRNKVNLNLNEENETSEGAPMVYNLGGSLDSADSSIPAWIVACKETEKTLN